VGVGDHKIEREDQTTAELGLAKNTSDPMPIILHREVKGTDKLGYLLVDAESKILVIIRASIGEQAGYQS
jgi:hypothetical protein